MTALAQGCAGLALVMGFALLRTRQVSAAVILLVVQSVAAAVSAVVLHQPFFAAVSLLLGIGLWLAHRHFSVPVFIAQGSALKARTRLAMVGARKQLRIAAPGLAAGPQHAASDPLTIPVGGPKLGVAVAAILAVLCQSQGGLALPLSVILVSVLLVATRQHPFMHLAALAMMANGLVLAASLMAPTGIILSPVWPLAGVLLPLPLAAFLMIPLPVRRKHRASHWLGWIDISVSLIVFLMTFLIHLDPLGVLFAPLLALDGVLQSFRRRKRHTLAPEARGLTLLTNIFIVLSVCLVSPVSAWIMVIAAATSFLWLTMMRRWNDGVAVLLAAGITLFGLLVLASQPLIVGYFSLFAGCAMLAAIVPDLAAVLVILLFRMANHATWPPLAYKLELAIAVLAVLACAAVLAGIQGRVLVRPAHHTPVILLQLGQAGIAALALGLGGTDGRFTALIILLLLVLTRAAARVTEPSVRMLAVAGLAGVPPLGVFPGLVLAASVVVTHDAWLLLPLGAAMIPFLIAGLPRRLPDLPPLLALPSIGWVPFGSAVFIGYFAPDRLVRLCHLLASGP